MTERELISSFEDIEPPDDEEEMERCIEEAENCGILLDKRRSMPKGLGKWPTHPIGDILGCCIHQNGSNNSTDPLKTARYHTSKNNHITPGRAMPTICYDFAIPDLPEPAWLVANPLDRKYAQGSSKHPGDENRHLLSILVMGGFSAPGYLGYTPGPSLHQLRNLEALVHWCQSLFCFGDNAIFGHADFGKSTCLAGDTQVTLLDGKEATLADLCEQKDNYWFYSCDEEGKIATGGPAIVRKTGIDQQTLQIHLDNDEVIVCTPAHLFRTYAGCYLPAKELHPGVTLTALSGGFCSVRTIQPGASMDVYDVIHCEPHHNFCLSAGVFVHNCPGSMLMDWIETRREDAQKLETVEDWQKALLKWDAGCLSEYGADGIWGDECKYALSSFQRAVGIKPTAFQDVFTELMLLRKVNLTNA